MRTDDKLLLATSSSRSASVPLFQFSQNKDVVSYDRSVLREVAAGIVVASLSLPLCVAAGVLAYAPLGRDFAGTGALAGVFCAAVGGIAAASVRRSSFITTIPTTPIAVIQASFVSSALAPSVNNEALLLLAIPACVVLVGLWQLLFVASGFARIVKFVPYPVVAGFVTGVGLLIALHQVPVFFNVRSLSDIAGMSMDQLFHQAPILIFGSLLVALIFILRSKTPHIPNLLVALLFGSVAFYLVHVIDPKIDLGRVVGYISPIDAHPHLDLSFWRELITIPALLKAVFVCSLTLAIVGTLDTFFSLRTAQNLADIRFDPRRELSGQAIGNMFSAFSGGLVVSTSLSLTTANYEAGGRSRLSTITSGFILLISALLFPRLISSLPLVVLASILIASSYRLIDWRWFETLRAAISAETVGGRRKAQRDSATLLIVLLATVIGEPIAGVVIGFGLSCLIFLVDMSRPVVESIVDGSAVHSKRLRSRIEHESLRTHGKAIKIFDLQGVLFFGNAYNLTEQIRAVQDETEIIILNCRRVTNVDNSGWRIFAEVAAQLQKQGKCLLICAPSRMLATDLDHIHASKPAWKFFANLDEALEWAEDHILDSRLGKVRLTEIPFDQSNLACEMTQTDLAALLARMSIVQYKKGDLLCRRGEPSDRLWILTKGTVSVRVKGPDSIRLASLGPGCTIGEMGLLNGKPRSADVCADNFVTAYMLTAENFDRVLADKPELGQRLLISIARQLTQRLYDMSEELRAVSVA